jgi:glycosyltransferase involved in cell wall biosynthesis
MVDSSNDVKLCIATPLFFPTYGGAQLRYLRYLPGLMERGLDVSVFTGTATAADYTPEAVFAKWGEYPTGAMLPVETINGAPVHRVRLPEQSGGRRRWIFNRKLLHFCRDTGHRPEVLQLLGTIRIGSIPYLRRLRRLGVSVLYSVTTASKVMRKRSGFDSRLFRFRLIYNAMDGIVCNTESLREGLLEMGVTKRVAVIPNGVDLERFRAAKEGDRADELRRRFGVRPDELVIIAVGGIMSRKGSDILVQAFTTLNRQRGNTHLLFVGPRQTGDEAHHLEFQNRLDQLVRESGLASRIHFVDLTDKVADYLRAADIFVLASTREGLPNSTIEAMACGKPVVMTPFVGLSDDLGEPGREYLLTERNPEALAGAFRRLIDDAGMRDELAHRGQDWIVANMSLDRSLDRYAQLYREMATTKGPLI